MGQVWDRIQDTVQGKEVRQRQLRKITDRIFDRFTAHSGKQYLTLDELYIAILLVFNDINKIMPGPHTDPPSKEEVQEMMQIFDRNLDGELSRDEFAEFVKKFTSKVVTRVSKNVVIAVVAAPILALMTKRATERAPRVGKVVQKIPNTVYASIITAAVVFIHKISESRE
eukprot:Gb_19501 [translate_table: standard]